MFVKKATFRILTTSRGFEVQVSNRVGMYVHPHAFPTHKDAQAFAAKVKAHGKIVPKLWDRMPWTPS